MCKEISFDDFCKKIGFTSYPFNSFTAENEKEYQRNLFVYTKFYSPLIQAFEAGNTMILRGDRGTGKTSITYDFIRRVPENTLVCKIDNFESLDIKYSDSDLYRFILKCVVNNFFLEVSNLHKIREKLTENEKILLTYFYVKFADKSTRGEATRVAEKIQLSPVRRFLSLIYHFLRVPLNLAANLGTGILLDVVARSVGGEPKVNEKISEYFPEVFSGVEDDFQDSSSTFEALRKFLYLVEKIGFIRIVIILDKIDEDQRLDNSAELIADFIKPILTNNKFLLDDSFQTIVSLWVVPLNFLKDKVRMQKINSPEIVWTDGDLKYAYNRRMKVFSDKNINVTFDSIFDVGVSKELKGTILDLSNRNPRDLWHIMNYIFRFQFNKDPASVQISSESIEGGIDKFVREFNFYEYYPRKANHRSNSMDVYSYIKYLLKLDDCLFTRKQLKKKAGTGGSTASYILGMENLGLIEKDSSGRGVTNYRIRDPKVRYALDKKIPIERN